MNYPVTKRSEPGLHKVRMGLTRYEASDQDESDNQPENMITINLHMNTLQRKNIPDNATTAPAPRMANRPLCQRCTNPIVIPMPCSEIPLPSIKK